MKKIIIGSRGSKLALLYAEKARECLLNSSDLSNDDIQIKKIVIRFRIRDYRKLEEKDYFQKILKMNF